MTSIRALLCLLVVAFVPTLAGAQAPGDVLVQDEESIQFFVSWGFNGQSMIAERWTPVRVYVWSGADAVSGTLEISYRQDASQSMRIVAPFSTTPGRAVPIETALALPSGCQSVSVRLLSERGRRLRARTFSRSSSRDDEQMPQILASTGVPLLNLGQTGIEQVSTAIVGETFGADQRTRTSPASDLWSRLTIFKSAPLDMPSSWMAYDALGVVVLESSRVSAIPRASLDALRHWLRAGGSLVLIADEPGNDWRPLLTSPGAAPPVRLAPPTAIPSHEDLEDLVEPSPALTARPITLTPLGERAGWTTRWIDPTRGALIAEGPVGLGWAIVVTADPQRIPRIASDDETAYLWREILRDTLGLSARDRPDVNMYWGGFGYEPSGATPRQRAAISTILDHTLRAPPPGAGVFVLLIVAVVFLAILVGPVDAIGLKKLRKRQHSWATALVYIALACVPAALLPVLFRTGPTMYARSRCVDTLPPSLGGDSVHTALSSTFAASPGPVRFVDPAPGSWWRPVSALSAWNSAGAVGARLDCVQTSLATPDGLARQNVPNDRAGNAQRLWTLRTTMDQQRDATRISASLSRDRTTVRVAGLPEGCVIASGALALPASDPAPSRDPGWFDLQPVAVSAGAAELRLPDTRPAQDPAERWRPLHVPEQQPWMWNSSSGGYRPSRFNDLPGATDRSRAIDAYLASGHFALLMLELEHAAPDTALSVDNARTNVLEVHRVLIPMPEPLP